MRASTLFVATWVALSMALAPLVLAQRTVTNPTDSSYDPQTGKFYGPDGRATGPPPVPPFLKNRGWGQDPQTGHFIDPSGGSVDPSSFYPSPDKDPNPDGVTYDPGTKTFFGQAGAKPYVDLPPYLEERGYRSDPGNNEITDPDGNLIDPSTLFPAPGRDPILRYDPQTGKYYTADGNECPPIPSPEQEARGWRLAPGGGQWIDPSGNRVSPETAFDPPSESNPGDLSYDPNTGKYFDRQGDLVTGELPDYMIHRGWKIDPNTGEIKNPNGSKVDPATMFPEPQPNPSGFTYDPATRTFFGGGGIPELPDYMVERGWRLDSRSMELIDPQGNAHDPSTYYSAPSMDPGFLYDPATGKFYTPGGLEIPPNLPLDMQRMGWHWNGTSFIDPSGAAVAPGTLCPNPHPGPLPTGRPATTPTTPTGPTTPPVSPGSESSDVPGPTSMTVPDFWYGPPSPTSSADFSSPGDLPLDVSSLNTSAAVGGTREIRVQLEIVFVPRTNVTGNGRAGALRDAESRRAPGRERWVPNLAELFTPPNPRLEPGARIMTVAAGTVGHRPLAASWPGPPPRRLPPAYATPVQPGAEAPVTALFTSRGVSTGEAFEVEFVNDGTAPIDIGATGLVLEPLTDKTQKTAREAFARAAKGKRTSKATATGYCLELMRDPPPAGMVFRIAPPELQEQFTPMRDIWRSAKQLLDAGGLSPDSDPTQYFHSIVQWSVWSKENGFDLESFGKAFLDRTKKNFTAAGQPWTDQVQQAVQQITPNRWNDIQHVLSESERLRAAVMN